MDCWSSCSLKHSDLDNLTVDGKYQKRKMRVSDREVQEWNLRLRENRITMDETNIRKKQTEIHEMLGIKSSPRRKPISESYNLLNMRSGLPLKECREKEVKDPLDDFEEALITREKSIREAEELLKDLIGYYETSFKLTDDKKTWAGVVGS